MDFEPSALATRSGNRAAFLFLVVGVIALGGCKCGSDPEIVPDAGNVDSGEQIPDAAEQVLSIEPASLELEVSEPGSTSTFRAFLDGVDVSERVVWTIDRSDIAILAAGVVTPAGDRGGEAQITATLGDRTATAGLTVRIRLLLDPDGLEGSFVEGDEVDGRLRIDYPFPEVVVPRNVQPVEVQWTSPEASTVLRITWKEQFAIVTHYVQGGVTGDAKLDGARWRSLTDSGAGAEGDPVTLSIARSGFAPVSQTLRIAQGDLPGVIVAERADATLQVLRQSIEDVEPSPRFAAAGCVGCHATSRDGRRTAVAIDGNTPFQIRVVDLAADTLEYLPGLGADTPAGGTFSTFSPLGDRLVTSTDRASGASAARLELWDLATATRINPDLMGAGCAEPEWSPDGQQLAAICQIQAGGWMFDRTSGALVVGTWSSAADGTLSAVQTLVENSAVPGRPAYPSWSSDSSAVAFFASSAGSRSTDRGELYVVGREGGSPVRLDRAAAGAPSFYPAFAPVRAGGFHWIAFTRRAPFGHKLTSSAKALWVAAIDPISGALDPSRPPFYLQGQLAGPMSIVRFPRDVCRDEAAACDVGIDCCSGTCVEGTCAPAGLGTCVADTNACASASECCTEGASCDDGFCIAPFPR